jgi:hypothetical protein
VVLDMSNLPTKWTTFIARHSGRHEQDSNCRVFLTRGEHMTPADRTGLRSLIVTYGQATVIGTDGSITVIADGAALDLRNESDIAPSARSVQAVTEVEAIGFSELM